MYERMLDKQHVPTPQEFAAYCGDRQELFEAADAFLMEQSGVEKIMRFPYGKSYGWGMKYFVGSRHICDIFAEQEAFSVMIRLSNDQYEKIRPQVSPYTKEYIDHKYPCGNGGWIQYRVLNPQHVEELKYMLLFKLKKQRAQPSEGKQP